MQICHVETLGLPAMNALRVRADVCKRACSRPPLERAREATTRV